jgi:hypothetical protein
MAEIPNDLKKMLFERNVKLCVWMHNIFTYLGVVFMLMGIISDAINKTLGLEPTNWFLLAIGFWMIAIFSWFRGYYSAKEK